MYKILTIGLAGILLASCSAPGPTIEGKVAVGGGDKTYLIEQVAPQGVRYFDSVRTDKNGHFTYKFKEKPGNPEFYNVRLTPTAVIPLLVDGTEKVVLEIPDSTARGYKVTGSSGSHLVQQAYGIMSDGAGNLNRLELAYDRTDDPAELEKIVQDHAAAWTALKQTAASFVVNNSASLAAIVPLYQPLPDGEFLFGELEDVVYYRMLADTLQTLYPVSAYARSLAADAQSMENLVSAQNLIERNIDNEVTFPDVEMSDALGRKHRLSELKGKVILLSFTATNLAELNVLNRELVEVYEKNAERGFEIYQVYLDVNKAAWINNLAQQKLPWITVSDLKGGDSPVVSLYNVQNIPANYLIDREGVIVQRNIPTAGIGKAVEALLK